MFCSVRRRTRAGDGAEIEHAVWGWRVTHQWMGEMEQRVQLISRGMGGGLDACSELKHASWRGSFSSILKVVDAKSQRKNKNHKAKQILHITSSY